jgi:hypothetical protein
VRRFLLQALVSMGVLVALAILDLGPRATAAYLSMASKQAGAGLDTGMSADDGSASLPKIDSDRAPNLRVPTPQGDLVRGMSTVPSPSNPSGSPQIAADLAPTTPPTSGLVAYFRDSPDFLPLSAFLDALLDPPRVA